MRIALPMQNNLLKILITLTLICSSQAFAIGLGKPTLHSALGEKLFIEIPVMGISNVDKDSLLFTVAPMETYQELGVDFHPSHHTLRFSTIPDSNGGLTLLVVSTQPINEPLLNFVIKMSTPAVEVIKEVSILLDTTTPQ